MTPSNAPGQPASAQPARRSLMDRITMPANMVGAASAIGGAIAVLVAGLTAPGRPGWQTIVTAGAFSGAALFLVAVAWLRRRRAERGAFAASVAAFCLGVLAFAVIAYGQLRVSAPAPPVAAQSTAAGGPLTDSTTPGSPTSSGVATTPAFPAAWNPDLESLVSTGARSNPVLHGVSLAGFGCSGSSVTLSTQSLPARTRVSVSVSLWRLSGDASGAGTYRAELILSGDARDAANVAGEDSERLIATSTSEGPATLKFSAVSPLQDCDAKEFLALGYGEIAKPSTSTP